MSCALGKETTDVSRRVIIQHNFLRLCVAEPTRRVFGDHDATQQQCLRTSQVDNDVGSSLADIQSTTQFVDNVVRYLMSTRRVPFEMTKNPSTASVSDFVNPFRRHLHERRRLIGCWASLGNAITTEVIGVAGFDWILLDCEHAPNDVLSLVPQLMALKDSPSAAVVRPPSNDPITIKRMLDIGCHNFLIPMVDSVAQARAAVGATRYPPEGIRGVSVSQRSNRYGAISNYFDQVNAQISVVVQIESRAGVTAASDIAAIDGVDALFVGPSDLAAAYGRLGNPNHPDVQVAIKEVLAAGGAAGKSTGILAPVENDARRYLDQGFNIVAVGSDLGVLRTQSQALCDRYRQAAIEPIADQY